jgi:chromosome segregation ATPase
MTTETPRVALFQRLNEVLGPDHASTLMTYLPTEEPATKSDIGELKSAIRDLTSGITGLRTELKTDISELRTELKTDISELRTELKTDISELRTELKTDISELRTELKSDLREMEQRLSVRMDGVDTRLNNHDQRFDNVHEAMRQQTRTFILATTGTMVTLSALAFGAAALI